MEIYLVGGAVRDKMMGEPVKDKDWVVTGATPDDLLALGYIPVGKDFPVFLHPETKEEYALARTERKTGAGYHGFQFHAEPSVSLRQDVMRRDLTINALAEGSDGKLIDYVGGREDLENKVLRHVSPAFAEDPVRILRVARFAARFAKRGFSIADSTMMLMKEMVDSGEVDALVPERVWQETVRALGEDSPEVFFETLRTCGALRILFPEIDRLFGVPQPEQHHPEIDTGLHTMMVLQQACLLSDSKVVRFAALTHDLGKGTTPKAVLPHHYDHEIRGYYLVKELADRYRIPNEFRQLGELMAKYHTHCHRAFELRPKTLLKTLNALDAFRRPERFAQFLLACEADSKGRTGYEQRAYPQAAFFARVREVADTVDVQQIIADGFEKEAIRDELRRRQLAEISQLKREYQAV